MWDNEKEPPEGRGSREDMWGIRRRDSRWFQVLTLIGGAAGSIGLTMLQIKHRSDTPDAVALNILLGIGASFIAAGFVAWGLLQIKELIMAIADWIREATEKRRQRIRAEGYRRGYQDASQGKPPEVPSDRTGQTPPRESDKGD